jgi:hypothetical protein
VYFQVELENTPTEAGETIYFKTRVRQEMVVLSGADVSRTLTSSGHPSLLAAEVRLLYLFVVCEFAGVALHGYMAGF